MIALEIISAVKSDNVDAPFSKFKPLTKDISKSFISSDLLYGGKIFKFSNAWLSINLSVFP